MKLKNRAVSVAVSLAVALCFSVISVYAQSNNQPDPSVSAGAPWFGDDFDKRLKNVSAMIDDRIAKENIPGYCLIILKDGRVCFQKPCGFADIAGNVPVTADTVFGLASLTKTFTAITLLSLVDKGLVSLDDPLSKYVDGLTDAYKPLTIRQLASMAAGVPSKVSEEVLWKDQLPILVNTPLVSQPGSEFLYSNFSYRLIGDVITKVTNRPFLDVVNETILGPLAMSSTATTVLLKPTGNVAQGYGDNNGQVPVHPIQYKNPAVSFSAGMLASTGNDLTKYVQGLLSGQILSKQGYKTLWYDRPALSSGKPCKWAFGWASNLSSPNLGNQFSVAMNGGTQGVASTIIILPNSKSAVIALANLRKPSVYAIAKEAARIAFGDANATAEPEEHVGASED